MKPGDVLKIKYIGDLEFSTVELLRFERGFLVVKDLETGEEYPCRPHALEILTNDKNNRK
jgi:hypothetical protein